MLCEGCRRELEGELGRVEDAALLHLSKQQQALLRWQQQLNPTQQGGKLGVDGGDDGKLGPRAEHDLPAVPAMSAEEAVLALCGVTPDVAAEAYAAAVGGADGGAAAASAAAFAAALAPKPSAPRVATAAEQAAVEADVFGAKGRVLNAEAGARWLLQWCQRVTGASDGDDTVATAVCRTLLSGEPDTPALPAPPLCLAGPCRCPALSLSSRLSCPAVHITQHAQQLPCTAPWIPRSRAGRSDDELAAELFDLMGDAVFEHIGDLLQQRASIAANVRRVVSGMREAEEADKAAAAMPSYGSTVTVMSESQASEGQTGAADALVRYHHLYRSRSCVGMYHSFAAETDAQAGAQGAAAGGRQGRRQRRSGGRTRGCRCRLGQVQWGAGLLYRKQASTAAAHQESASASLAVVLKLCPAPVCACSRLVQRLRPAAGGGGGDGAGDGAHAAQVRPAWPGLLACWDLCLSCLVQGVTIRAAGEHPRQRTCPTPIHAPACLQPGEWSGVSDRRWRRADGARHAPQGHAAQVRPACCPPLCRCGAAGLASLALFAAGVHAPAAPAVPADHCGPAVPATPPAARQDIQGV